MELTLIGKLFPSLCNTGTLCFTNEIYMEVEKRREDGANNRVWSCGGDWTDLHPGSCGPRPERGGAGTGEDCQEAVSRGFPFNSASGLDPILLCRRLAGPKQLPGQPAPRKLLKMEGWDENTHSEQYTLEPLRVSSTVSRSQSSPRALPNARADAESWTH